MTLNSQNHQTELRGLRRQLNQLQNQAGTWRAHNQNANGADPYADQINRLRNRIARTEARAF